MLSTPFLLNQNSAGFCLKCAAPYLVVVGESDFEGYGFDAAVTACGTAFDQDCGGALLGVVVPADDVIVLSFGEVSLGFSCLCVESYLGTNWGAAVLLRGDFVGFCFGEVSYFGGVSDGIDCAQGSAVTAALRCCHYYADLGSVCDGVGFADFLPGGGTGVLNGVVGLLSELPAVEVVNLGDSVIGTAFLFGIVGLVSDCYG